LNDCRARVSVFGLTKTVVVDERFGVKQDVTYNRETNLSPGTEIVEVISKKNFDKEFAAKRPTADRAATNSKEGKKMKTEKSTEKKLSYNRVLAWMGKQDFTFEQARAGLEKLAMLPKGTSKTPVEFTVKHGLSGGRTGRVEPAELTTDQQDALREIAKIVEPKLNGKEAKAPRATAKKAAAKKATTSPKKPAKKKTKQSKGKKVELKFSKAKQIGKEAKAEEKTGK
jgi:hypothetical protein